LAWENGDTEPYRPSRRASISKAELDLAETLTEDTGERMAPMDKRLSVYYFKGQDFCVDRRIYRDDMKRLADAAVDSICIAVHEGDLAGSNLPNVCQAAHRAGIEVWAVPSRVGALVAGWHRGVGYLSAGRPDLWARHADAACVNFFGPMISVHHPESAAAFIEVIESMLEALPISGIIWDELKSLDIEDHSEAALAACGGPAKGAAQVEATAAFFSGVNRELRTRRPELTIAMFLYCFMPDDLLARCAAIDGLDEFGCDGSCLRPTDRFPIEGGMGKILLPENFSRFAAAADRTARRRFVLVETQTHGASSVERTLERLDELFALEPHHLVYYDYPRNMDDAERLQPLLAERFATWRRS
jgi:hypothetical protein